MSARRRVQRLSVRRTMPDGEAKWRTRVRCDVCNGCFWVCENHNDRPWDGDNACNCGGAGMPCPKCNVSTLGEVPKELAGSTTICSIPNGERNSG